MFPYFTLPQELQSPILKSIELMDYWNLSKSNKKVRENLFKDGFPRRIDSLQLIIDNSTMNRHQVDEIKVIMDKEVELSVYIYTSCYGRRENRRNVTLCVPGESFWKFLINRITSLKSLSVKIGSGWKENDQLVVEGVKKIFETPILPRINILSKLFLEVDCVGRECDFQVFDLILSNLGVKIQDELEVDIFLGEDNKEAHQEVRRLLSSEDYCNCKTTIWTQAHYFGWEKFGQLGLNSDLLILGYCDNNQFEEAIRKFQWNQLPGKNKNMTLLFRFLYDGGGDLWDCWEWLCGLYDECDKVEETNEISPIEKPEQPIIQQAIYKRTQNGITSINLVTVTQEREFEWWGELLCPESYFEIEAEFNVEIYMKVLA